MKARLYPDIGGTITRGALLGAEGVESARVTTA